MCGNHSLCIGISQTVLAVLARIGSTNLREKTKVQKEGAKP
jgi:hypothetical protein